MPSSSKKFKLEAGETPPAEAPVNQSAATPPAQADAPVNLSEGQTETNAELDAVLARAEARVEEQEAEEAAPEQELTMAEMQVLMAEQRAQITQLQAQVQKLTKLALLHDDNIAVLDRNIRRIDGEAVLTMSVPRATPPGAKLEAIASSKGIALSAPVPSDTTRKAADAALQSGLEARHGGSGAKSDTPVRASRQDDEARLSFAASQHRARHDASISNS